MQVQPREIEMVEFVPKPIPLLQKPLLYYTRFQTLKFDSARQSSIEALRSERRAPSPIGKGDNSKFETACGVHLFSFLNSQELLRAALVCRTWHSISRDPLLWYRFRSEIFNHSVHKEEEWRKKFSIPEVTHHTISNDGKRINLKVKNSDEIISIDHINGLFTKRKATHGGQSYLVLDEGVFTFNKKVILFTQNNGNSIQLPIWFDRNNQYDSKHVTCAKGKIFILQTECLSVYDLKNQHLKVLNVSDDYDHSLSSIHEVGGYLFFVKRNRSAQSFLEIWDIEKMNLLVKENCSSWVIIEEDEPNLYICGNLSVSIIDLKTLTRRKKIVPPRRYSPNFNHFDRFSKKIAEVKSGTLHLYDPFTNIHQELEFDSSRRIFSISKISQIGRFVICRGIYFLNADRETSLWEVKNNKLSLFKVLNEQVRGGGFAQGVFYQIQGKVLNVFDKTFPPFRSLIS